MFAQITKDYLDCTDILGPEFQREGKIVVGSPSTRPRNVVECRLYDDDGNHLFDAVASNDGALEELHAWGAADVGATRLDVWREGTWVMEIA